MEIIAERNPKAAKEHRCDGHWQIKDYISEGETDNEGEILAQICSGRIDKGQKYYLQVAKDCSDFWQWRSCETCWEIIKKHKMYFEY